MAELHYGAALAAIHHAHFGAVAQDAANELLARLSAAGIDRGLVVDLAAGSGILSRRVVDAGFEAVAVDLSPAMLSMARSLVPEAKLVCGSLWDTGMPGEPGSVVAVAAVGEAFSYATDPTASLPALGERLAAIHRALVPGGLLLFDVAGPGRSGPMASRERSFDADGARLRIREHEEATSSTLTRDLTIFLPPGRRTHETHRLTLYDPEEIEALLTKNSFAGERLKRYDQTQFPPGWHGFAATKPN